MILNASSSIGKTGINIEFPKVITSGIEAKANKSIFFDSFNDIHSPAFNYSDYFRLKRLFHTSSKVNKY